MSSRKQRQLEHTSPVMRIVEHVRSLADMPFVRDVEDHYAGYFDELGITVNLHENATDEQVILLRNLLLEHLERVFAEEPLPFTWQVAFWRGLEQVALLFPGNRLIAPGQPLELICD